MLSIGVGRRKVAWHIVSGVLVVALIATVLSAGLSYFLQEWVFDVALGATTVESTRIGTFSEVPVSRGTADEQQDRLRAVFTPENMPLLLAAIACLQLSMIVLPAWIGAVRLLRVSPLALVNGREG